MGTQQRIRNFPQEVPGTTWPLLQPTQEDKQYQPIIESEVVRARRKRGEYISLVYRDIRDSLFKGAILGLLCFGLFFGVIRNLSLWWQGWHWAIALIGIILLRVLFGSDVTLIALVLVVVVVSVMTMLVSPLLLPLLFLFIIGGMFVRGTLELLPERVA
jgi:hypothetical protein